MIKDNTSQDLYFTVTNHRVLGSILRFPRGEVPESLEVNYELGFHGAMFENRWGITKQGLVLIGLYKIILKPLTEKFGVSDC